MTKNERAVREVHPRADLRECFTRTGSYFVVLAHWSDAEYIGSGATPAKAWKNAAEVVARTPAPASAPAPPAPETP